MSLSNSCHLLFTKIPSLTPDHIIDLERGVADYAQSHSEPGLKCVNERRFIADKKCRCFSCAYKARGRMLYQNMTTVAPLITEGRGSAYDIASTWTQMQMHSKLYEDYNELCRAEQEAKERAKAQVEMGRAESMLQCGKCKQYKVQSVQVQLASADEAMCNLCTCLNCGHKFKFS